MPAPNYVLEPCAHCGKPVRRTVAQIAGGVHRFCDRACFAAWYGPNRITKACAVCGKPFTLKPSKAVDRRHCSQACYDVARRQQLVTYVCRQCGRRYRRPDQKLWNGSVFCSSKCQGLHRRMPESARSIYAHEFTPELKRSIRKRDKATCQLCGCTNRSTNGRKLHVHHIDYDKTNNHPSNLVTLCHNCHSRTNYDRPSWRRYFAEHLPQEIV